MNVKSRAHRILKPLASYRDLTGQPLNVPCWAADVPVKNGEVCYGVYENSPCKANESIAVTNLGIHVCRNKQSEFIAYSQIASVSAPPEKQTASELSIHLLSGQVISLPVRGGEGRFRDAFEFLRFLDRVTHDLRRNPLVEN